jgi:hypothetical protein
VPEIIEQYQPPDHRSALSLFVVDKQGTLHLVVSYAEGLWVSPQPPAKYKYMTKPLGQEWVHRVAPWANAGFAYISLVVDSVGVLHAIWGGNLWVSDSTYEIRLFHSFRMSEGEWSAPSLLHTRREPLIFGQKLLRVAVDGNDTLHVFYTLGIPRRYEGETFYRTRSEAFYMAGIKVKH